MKISFLGLFLFLALGLCAQTRAVTDQGREVILYDNGKWVYASDSSGASPLDSIRLSPIQFSTPADAKFVVKSNRINVGVTINPNKWIFKSGEETSPATEYLFTMKSTEGYALLITEKTSIELESLRSAVLVNARKAAPDLKETFAEYRKVNGVKVLYLELVGTVKGITFSYVGYYYSNSKGTMQLLGFTTQSSFDAVKPKLLELLNGFVELKN